MKEKLFLLIMLSSYFSSSQKTENYSGVIMLDKGSAITFEMEFIEDKGIVNGFSITGKGTPDETKSDISGTFNQNTKTYKLKETQVLSTKSEANINTFCYIDMEITEKRKFSVKKYEGNFTGYFKNGKKCASGKIMLIEKGKLEKKVEKVKKKLDKIKKKENEEEVNVMSTKILKDGEDMIIQVCSNKITIYVWDANEEDGDKINLSINGKTLLNDFITRKKRKKIRHKLKQGENIIEITAKNLGNTPPNTSQIEIVDSKKKYAIITQLDFNKKAVIKITK